MLDLETSPGTPTRRRFSEFCPSSSSLLGSIGLGVVDRASVCAWLLETKWNFRHERLRVRVGSRVVRRCHRFVTSVAHPGIDSPLRHTRVDTKRLEEPSERVQGVAAFATDRHSKSLRDTLKCFVQCFGLI